MTEAGRADGHRSFSLYEAVVEATVDGIISIDARGVILSFNRAASTMFGYAREEVIGQNVSMLMPEPDHSAHDGYLDRYQQRGEARIIGIGREVEGLRKDGTKFPLDLSVSEAVDEEGAPIFAGILRDISVKRESERTARFREERYRSLLRAAPIGVAITDESRLILEANDALATMLGVPVAEIIGTRLRHFERAHERQPGGRFAKLLAGEVEQVEFLRELVRSGGESVWARTITAAVRGEGGAFQYAIRLVEDVTAEVASRTALAASEERFRTLFDSAPIGIALLDEQRRSITVNPALTKMLDRTPEELMGQDLQRFTDLSQTRLGQGLFRKVVEGEAGFMVREREMAKRDGSTVWTQQTTSRVEDEKGRFIFAIRTVTDISDLKRTEAALRASQDDLMRLSQRNKSVIRSAGDGILALDIEGNIVSLNPAAARILGTSESKAIGRRGRDLLTLLRSDGSRYPEGESIVGLVLLDGVERETTNERVIYENGTSADVERLVSPLHSEDGSRIVGAVEMIRDVTERKRVERAKSEFLAMTSHELRTPLTAIHAAVGLSASGALGALPPEVKHQLDIASANSDRLVSLVNDIVTLEQFGLGKAQLSMHPTDIAIVVGEAVSMVAPIASPDDVILDIQATSVIVDCDASRIQQVLLNLLSNALKYAPPRSTVVVTAEAADRYVTISVVDGGKGIDADGLGMVFEQFQQVEPSSTRQHQGSGLGLAIAKAIVEQHHGSIWVESVVGKGTSFSFRLPLVQ
jgi:PAS domain S-box-containing protein